MIAKPKSKKPPLKTKTPSPKAKKPVVSKKTKPASKAAPKAKAASKALPELLRDAALKILDERQGEDIATFDLKGRSAIADYVIVASGRSSRQLVAIADYLRQAFSKAGISRVRVEGLAQADWVLIDAGDVLVHLFRSEVRDYYQIEEIWAASSPIRRK